MGYKTSGKKRGRSWTASTSSRENCGRQDQSYYDEVLSYYQKLPRKFDATNIDRIWSMTMRLPNKSKVRLRNLKRSCENSPSTATVVRIPTSTRLEENPCCVPQVAIERAEIYESCRVRRYPGRRPKSPNGTRRVRGLLVHV